MRLLLEWECYALGLIIRIEVLIHSYQRKGAYWNDGAKLNHYRSFKNNLFLKVCMLPITLFFVYVLCSAFSNRSDYELWNHHRSKVFWTVMNPCTPAFFDNRLVNNRERSFWFHFISFCIFKFIYFYIIVITEIWIITSMQFVYQYVTFFRQFNMMCQEMENTINRWQGVNRCFNYIIR